MYFYIEKSNYMIKKITSINIIIFLAIIFLSFNNQAFAQDINSKTAEIKIQTSAVCGMCKQRIETDLAFEKGVKSVALDEETKIVTVGYSPKKTDPDKIRLAISKIGYDADTVPADPVAYEKLPACCKKGNKPH
jgi:periplasmic mercuric ion binding protein